MNKHSPGKLEVMLVVRFRFERVTLMCVTGQDEATATKLSLKLTQNERKKSRQRDLVEFSVR
jgi:hypothetical protein